MREITGCQKIQYLMIHGAQRELRCPQPNCVPPKTRDPPTHWHLWGIQQNYATKIIIFPSEADQNLTVFLTATSTKKAVKAIKHVIGQKSVSHDLLKIAKMGRLAESQHLFQTSSYFQVDDCHDNKMGRMLDTRKKFQISFWKCGNYDHFLKTLKYKIGRSINENFNCSPIENFTLSHSVEASFILWRGKSP